MANKYEVPANKLSWLCDLSLLPFNCTADMTLTNDQGVLMPKANLRNLMLRSDVVQAVKDGKFHIYAVVT
jgi:hypothetical protein